MEIKLLNCTKDLTICDCECHKYPWDTKHIVPCCTGWPDYKKFGFEKPIPKDK